MIDIKRSFQDSPPSLVILVLTNLLPLFGIIFWEWKVFPVMVLFWLENIIVGFFFILRILTMSATGGFSHPLPFRIFGALFFTAHYGLFTWGHGVFIFVLFAPNSNANEIEEIDISHIISLIDEYHLTWILAGLFISHGFSYISNYLINKENQNINLIGLMSRPYIRIVILHVTIIFGGIAMVILNQPLIGLVILIFVKTGVDALVHLIEHGTLPNPLKQTLRVHKGNL